MRFRLLDQIVDLHPGKHITAVKRLRAEEEYLRDHFPLFPVMPGVLMLEALFQASMWLVRSSDDFSHAGVILREARNVKFADFVKPGQTLIVRAEIIRQESATTTLKAQGTVEDAIAVSGRLILEHFHLADRNPAYAPLDPFTRRTMRTKFDQLSEANAVSTGT